MAGDVGGGFGSPAVIDASSQTGIEELDRLLGGGFPKGSVVLLAGSPGSGKTIFSLQWLFEGVKEGENGVYITITEPLFKILKNLEGMSFYDRSAVEQEKLKILDLREIYGEQGFNPQEVIAYIERHLKDTNAKRLCIDSMTAIAYSIDDRAAIRSFIFELGKMLATLGCTTIMSSEVHNPGEYSVYGVGEFISDAILRFDQVLERGELVRVMQVIKVRGREYSSEALSFKISERGISVFPKLRVPLDYASSKQRVSTGNPGLDEMLIGGLFSGSSTLFAGATGTGKSLFSMSFVYEGLEKGEPCMYISFEESRGQIYRNALAFGWDFAEYERKGLLVLRCSYPGDRLLEEQLAEIKRIVDEKHIRRCVVDSLTALYNSLPESNFYEFSKRLNGYLKTKGVTMMFTAATGVSMGPMTISEINLSTMVDNIVVLRYVEVEGELRFVINVVKVRGSGHSKSLREYRITSQGIVIGQSLTGYEGVMTGVTRKVSQTVEEKIEAEFKRYVGPKAESTFMEVKKKGLTRENILASVDGLVSQGVLKDDDAASFKHMINAILGVSEDM
jgi:circadian clock protein KaiC